MAKTKPSALTVSIIVTAIVTAAATALGTKLSESWLPAAVTAVWSKVSGSEVVFVTLTRDARQTPLSHAVVRAMHPNPETKQVLDEAVTDQDGRAMLKNVGTRQFFLRIEYADGGRIYTYRENISVEQYPHRVAIAGLDRWERRDIEVSRPSVQLQPSAGPISTEAPWLKTALDELGVRETESGAGNPRISEYHTSAGLRAAPQSVPWSCSFVTWVLQQSGVAGGFKSAKCSDFLKFGSKIEDARVGAVAVLSREGVPEAVSGMAGFLVRADAQTVTLVVGNVDNQVTVAAYPRRQVREFRWPNGG